MAAATKAMKAKKGTQAKKAVLKANKAKKAPQAKKTVLKAMKAETPVKTTTTTFTRTWNASYLGIYNSWCLKKLEHNHKTGVVTETWLGTPR